MSQMAGEWENVKMRLEMEPSLAFTYIEGEPDRCIIHPLNVFRS